MLFNSHVLKYFISISVCHSIYSSAVYVHSVCDCHFVLFLKFSLLNVICALVLQVKKKKKLFTPLTT